MVLSNNKMIWEFGPDHDLLLWIGGGSTFGLPHPLFALIALTLVLSALFLLDGPVQRLAGLYESSFSLNVLDPLSLFGVILGGPALGLAGAWLAVGRHLAQIQPE